jgi:hypothetical protein
MAIQESIVVANIKIISLYTVRAAQRKNIWIHNLWLTVFISTYSYWYEYGMIIGVSILWHAM